MELDFGSILGDSSVDQQRHGLCQRRPAKVELQAVRPVPQQQLLSVRRIHIKRLFNSDKLQIKDQVI